MVELAKRDYEVRNVYIMKKYTSKESALKQERAVQVHKHGKLTRMKIRAIDIISKKLTQEEKETLKLIEDGLRSWYDYFINANVNLTDEKRSDLSQMFQRGINQIHELNKKFEERLYDWFEMQLSELASNIRFIPELKDASVGIHQLYDELISLNLPIVDPEQEGEEETEFRIERIILHWNAFSRRITDIYDELENINKQAEEFQDKQLKFNIKRIYNILNPLLNLSREFQAAFNSLARKKHEINFKNVKQLDFAKLQKTLEDAISKVDQIRLPEGTNFTALLHSLLPFLKEAQNAFNDLFGTKQDVYKDPMEQFTNLYGHNIKAKDPTGWEEFDPEEEDSVQQSEISKDLRSQQDGIVAYIDSAVTHLKNGDYDRAISHLQRLVSSSREFLKQLFLQDVSDDKLRDVFSKYLEKNIDYVNNEIIPKIKRQENTPDTINKLVHLSPKWFYSEVNALVAKRIYAKKVIADDTFNVSPDKGWDEFEPQFKGLIKEKETPGPSKQAVDLQNQQKDIVDTIGAAADYLANEQYESTQFELQKIKGKVYHFLNAVQQAKTDKIDKRKELIESMLTGLEQVDNVWKDIDTFHKTKAGDLDSLWQRLLKTTAYFMATQVRDIVACKVYAKYMLIAGQELQEIQWAIDNMKAYKDYIIQIQNSVKDNKNISDNTKWRLSKIETELDNAVHYLYDTINDMEDTGFTYITEARAELIGIIESDINDIDDLDLSKMSSDIHKLIDFLLDMHIPIKEEQPFKLQPIQKSDEDFSGLLKTWDNLLRVFSPFVQDIKQLQKDALEFQDKRLNKTFMELRQQVNGLSEALDHMMEDFDRLREKPDSSAMSRIKKLKFGEIQKVLNNIQNLMQKLPSDYKKTLNVYFMQMIELITAIKEWREYLFGEGMFYEED